IAREPLDEAPHRVAVVRFAGTHALLERTGERARHRAHTGDRPDEAREILAALKPMHEAAERTLGLAAVDGARRVRADQLERAARLRLDRRDPAVREHRDHEARDL